MNEEMIDKLEKRLEKAMLTSDIKALEKLLDDRLVFTNHIGQLISKQTDLEAHCSGFVKIQAITQSNRTVNIFENVAIVTVLSEITGLFGGNSDTAKLHFTRVWKRDGNGEYKVIAAHSSL